MSKLSKKTISIDASRRAKSAAWLSAFLFAISILTVPAYGQTAVRTLKTDPSSPNEKMTFWLYDENGSWRVPLPNWTLEDVMNAVDAREEESVATPYTIQSVDANGKVEDGVARMTVEIAVNVADGVVRVPLGLKEGVYIPTAEQDASGESRNGGFSFQGPGFVALDVDPSSGEYVAIVQSQTRRTRRRTTGSQSKSSEKSAESRPEQSKQTPKSDAAPENDAEQKPGDATDSKPAESAPAPEASAPAESTPAPEAPASPAESAPAPETPAPTESAPAPETPASPAESAPAPETPASPAESAPAPEAPAPTESAPASETPAPAESAPAPEARTVRAAVQRAYADEADEAQTPASSTPSDANREDSGVARLRPNQYVLKLELCFVVETVTADEFRLEASFPASGRSQFALETPLSNVAISSVKGAVAVPPTVLSETSTELNLRGLGRGGERTELVWRKAESKSDESQLSYQVEDASIDVTLSARETTYDATLPVRAYGGESDVFYVRLPEHGSLVADSVVATGLNGSLYSIKSAHETSEAALANEGDGSDPNMPPSDSALVEIQLEQPTSSVVLKLKARVPVVEESDDADGSGAKRAERPIAGFSVVKAQKQFGKVKISKSSDLNFDVSASYGAALGADSTLADDVETYSFFSQPFLLTAQGYDRQMIVNVKPEYQMTIGSESTQLRARFHYSVHGGKASEFKIRLNDWSLTYVLEGAEIDENAIYRNETTGETVFPLNNPVDGDVSFELSLASNVKPNEGDGRFAVALPTPTANWVEAAPVVVAPENNVELAPSADECVDLEPKTARALSLEMELPKLVQRPLYYQTRQILSSSGESRPASTFVATVRQLEQQVEVSARTDAAISESGEIHVRQNFTYNIDYEPLEVVSIEEPLAMLDPKGERFATNVKFFVDGNIVPQQNLRQVSTDGEQYVVRQILLNESPKIGTCVVTVQYDLAAKKFMDQASNYVDLVLTQPLDDKFLSNELYVSVPNNISIQYRQSDAAFWTLDMMNEKPSDDVPWNARFRSVMRETIARFQCLVSTGNFELQHSTVVERAWIQSWFSNNARYDRAAYRVSCRGESLAIQLPTGVRKDRVAVTLDKQPLKDVAAPESKIFVDDSKMNVPIPEELRKREFVLELSYVVPNTATNPIRTNGRSFVQFPRLTDDTTWVRRAYWQAIVPGDRHLITAPKNWTSEYFIKRAGDAGFFSRVASTSSEELSEWVGVDPGDKIPTSVNVYLFSSFSMPATAGFYMVDRALLILVGSGAALLFGLGLIYIPSVRSPLILFVLSVVALGVSAFQPTLALLFLQTTVVGVALTILTAFLAVVFGKKKSTNGESGAVNARPDAKKRAADAARTTEGV